MNVELPVSVKTETSMTDKNHESDNVIVYTKDVANDVINEMNSLIQKYGYVSVADFNDIRKVDSNWADAYYGWTSLEGVSINQVQGGFTIVMPKPSRLFEN